MAYGRQAVMNGLRMAGDKVRAVDSAYATRLAEIIEGKNPNAAQGVLAMLAGAEPGRFKSEVEPGDGQLARLIAQLAPYGAPAAGIGIRYGIPAAGAGLAAHGINSLYDTAENTQVLPM
jgi:hypothetical protein